MIYPPLSTPIYDPPTLPGSVYEQPRTAYVLIIPALNDDVAAVKDINKFKQSLKSLLTARCFYSVKDFVKNK